MAGLRRLSLCISSTLVLGVVVIVLIAAQPDHRKKS